MDNSIVIVNDQQKLIFDEGTKSSLKFINHGDIPNIEEIFAQGVEYTGMWFKGFCSGIASNVEVKTELKDKIIGITYQLARLMRNTDGLHPSTAGPLAGNLLLSLRLLDGNTYNQKVISPIVNLKDMRSCPNKQ